MINGIYNNVTTLPKKKGLLPRPRLDMLLSKATENNLVTVIAGAGYGKTHAVSMFLSSNKFRVAWMQLTNLDNYQKRFWEGFIYAISIQSKDLALQLEQLGFPDSLAKFHKFLHLLAKEIYIGERFIFVFDDFHYIQDESIIDFIENLILSDLENLCIILISRINLNLKRTFSLEKQITTEDLCFSLEETTDYFSMHDIFLPPSEINKIYEYTEGWPLVTYLAGLTLKKSDKPFDELLARTMPIVFRIIDNEIFSNYTPKTKEILVKLSLLDDSYGELLIKSIDESVGTVLEIVEGNMFIQYNPYTQNFHVHNLFLEFLKMKQVNLSHEQITQVYLKAADWYLKNDFKTSALTYYKICGHYDKIWDIIRNYEIDIPTDEADLLLELIESFPKDFLDKYPVIGVVHGRLLLNNGRLEESVNELTKIKNKFEMMPPTEENKAIIGEACIFLALDSLAMSDYKFVELFKTAAQCLPDGSVFVDNRLYINNGNYPVTIVKSDAGELKKFENAITSAMPYAAKAMNGCCYGLEFLSISGAGFYTGDMKKAEINAYNALYKAQQQQQNDTICQACFIILRKSITEGNYSKAAGALDEIKRMVGDPDSSDCLSIIDIIKGWFYSRLDDFDKVPGWIMNEDQSLKILSPNSTCKDRLIRAYCFLRTENYSELLAFLNYLEELYKDKGFLLARLDTQILKSIATYKIQDKKQSYAAFKSAYDLAYANSLIMPFIEYGNYMRSVIESIKRDENCTIPLQWLNKIQSKSNTYAKRLDNVRTQYKKLSGHYKNDKITLTRKESELIQALSHGLTRDEIAESLYISPNTVKSKLQNIYNKLGAVNGADAVRIAYQMKLIE